MYDDHLFITVIYILTCKIPCLCTLDYLLTGDDVAIDANVMDAERKGIPVIKLKMLKQVLLGEKSLDELIV